MLAATAVALATQGVSAQQPAPSAPSTLVSFSSDAEFRGYLRDLVRSRNRWRDSVAAAHRTSIATQPCSLPLTYGYTARPVADAVIVSRVTGPNGSMGSTALLRIEGTLTTVMTDTAGVARLVIPASTLDTPRTVRLVFRRLGFKARSVVLQVARGDSVHVDVGMCMDAIRLEEIVHTATTSVTNVQHAGVDEGGIVKLAGDYLVVLRRGRLHTIRVGRGRSAARPVHTIDAFGPGIDPANTWYDELLVANDRVVVIGYSYERGGTEVGTFRLGADGRLSYEATYQLRSDDYYSSRNYASRLIGTKLLFYTPLSLADDTMAIERALPSMRTWHDEGTRTPFSRIVTARNAYRPARPLRPDEPIVLHTVTSCDLASATMACEARVIIGPRGREFYMSPNAVYVWTAGRGDSVAASVVHRMPFDGARSTALRVFGSPIDQFSFLESDRHINVVVHDTPHGGEMWSSERPKNRLALLRVPLSAFGDGTDSAPPSAYRALASGVPGAAQNRFVGDYVILASGSGWRPQRGINRSDVYVAALRGGTVHRFATVHDVERIEVTGGNAVLVGADTADLHFTSIALGDVPRINGRFTIENAAQGELRSHGFFYKVLDDSSGVLGLPIREAGRPGYSHLFEESAAILFLRNTPRGFRPFGRLAADTRAVSDDNCVASCVDWYGNARPLFIGDRVFALLGAELVEGRELLGVLKPVRRVSFASR